MLTIYLEEYKDSDAMKEVVDTVLIHPLKSPVSITLFPSPQILVNNTIYQDFISKLIKKDMLKLLYIDKIQLFTQFGIWFRIEFSKPREYLFNKVKNKVPILFITASTNLNVMNELKILTGLTISDNNTI